MRDTTQQPITLLDVAGDLSIESADPMQIRLGIHERLARLESERDEARYELRASRAKTRAALAQLREVSARASLTENTGVALLGEAPR